MSLEVTEKDLMSCSVHLSTDGKAVEILDQTQLPNRTVWLQLTEPEQIYDAIRESENGRPALTPSVKLIEDYINSKGNSTVFPLSVPFNRTAVGRMQKTVLIPFGYEPNDKQAACRIGNFKTASCYSRTGKAVMKALVKTVDIND